MRTNKLFKKTIAVIAAVCTLVNATGFNGITAKASDITTININEECSGVITQMEDTSSEDYYTFTADESDSYYRLNIKAFDGDGVICYKVYTDAEMTEEIAYGDVYSGSNEVNDLVKEIKPSKQYYVKITAGSVESTLSYKFNIEKYSTDDFSDDRQSLNVVKVGSTQNGVMNHETDADYFTFTTDESDSFYYLNMKATIPDGYAQVHVKIYSDPEMTYEIASEEVNAGNTARYDLAKDIKPSKQYYVKVLASNSEMNPMNYEFSIEKKVDDVHDTVNAAKVIKLNESYKQTIENDKDVDCFRITTSNYINYDITFKGTSTNNINYYIYKDKEMTQLVKDGYIIVKGSISKQDGAVKLTPYKTYYIKVEGSENSSYTIGLNASSPANSKVKQQTVKKARQVTISWDKVNKATGYEVYRAEKNGTYKKVATIKYAKTTKWIDKKVKKGYTYKYKVRAYSKVKGKTYYSSYSSEKSVKVK